VQLATGNVVQKGHWFGAQFQKIVGGQGEKIVAYVLVQLVLQGEVDLGPHSLGGLRNDWLLVAEFLQAEQSSKKLPPKGAGFLNVQLCPRQNQPGHRPVDRTAAVEQHCEKLERITQGISVFRK